MSDSAREFDSNLVTCLFLIPSLYTPMQCLFLPAHLDTHTYSRELGCLNWYCWEASTGMLSPEGRRSANKMTARWLLKGAVCSLWGDRECIVPESSWELLCPREIAPSPPVDKHPRLAIQSNFCPLSSSPHIPSHCS